MLQVKVRKATEKELNEAKKILDKKNLSRVKTPKLGEVKQIK